MTQLTTKDQIVLALFLAHAHCGSDFLLWLESLPMESLENLARMERKHA